MGCPKAAPCGIRPGFPGLSRWSGQVAYALLTRAPVAGRRKQASAPVAPRLACVRPVASVHPEPGSNSPLLVCLFCLFLCLFDSPGGYALIYCVWVSIDRRLLSLVLLPSVYCNCCQCPSALRPGCRCSAVPVSKRVQSYAFLFLPPNFFSTLFIGPNRQIKPILCFTTCYRRKIIYHFNVR